MAPTSASSRAAVDAPDFVRVDNAHCLDRAARAAGRCRPGPAGSTRPARSGTRCHAAASNSGAKVEGVDAAVDLVDLPLGGRGVALLDDARDAARLRGRCGRSRGDRSTVAVSTVAAAPVGLVLRRPGASSVAAPSSGTSPESRTSVPVASVSSGSACSRAWPVPSCGSWTHECDARPAGVGLADAVGLVADDDRDRRGAERPGGRRARGRASGVRRRGAALSASRTSCACPCRRRGPPRGGRSCAVRFGHFEPECLGSLSTIDVDLRACDSAVDVACRARAMASPVASSPAPVLGHTPNSTTHLLGSGTARVLAVSAPRRAWTDNE